jgi:nitrite reductase/ring-hydroxylating ferredoxin subunit
MDALDGGRRSGRRGGYAAGADAAVAVGIVGAAAAALPGLADWHHTSGGTRRSGLVHGLLNTAALALYTGSLALRRAGRRGEGRALSGLGFAVLLAAAYIGGHLVYRLRLGVDRSQPTLESEEFVAAASLADLREGVLTRVDVSGVAVLLVRRGGRVAALAETCSHLGGPLADGRLEDDSVRCPWHGSRFSLEDGRVLEGPATAAQPCFETRVREGRVEIRRRQAAAAQRGDGLGLAAS